MKKLSVENIFYALVCSLFFLPLIFLTSAWSPFESPKIFFFLLIIELLLPCYLYLVWKHPEHSPSFKEPFLLTLIAFLFIETIAAAFGKDPLNSFFGNTERMDGVFFWYHLFLFFLYLRYLLQSNAQYQKTFIRIFLIVAGITAFIGILQVIDVVSFFTNLYGRRVTSTLGNPIFFASTLVIPFFLCVHCLMEEQTRKLKYVYGGLIALYLLALFATQTRGAFVGLLAGTVVWVGIWLWQNQQKKTKFHGLIVVAITLIFLTGLFFGIRSFSPQDSSLYRLTHFSDENTSARLIFWNYALKGFRDAPWLGVGYQNFSSVADRYFESSVYAFDNAWPDKPHNMFLEILVTGGIFAFLLYVGLFIVSIRSAISKHTFGVACIAGLTAYMIQNIFAFDTITSLQNIFLLFALTTTSFKTVSSQKPHQVPALIWTLEIFPAIFFILFLFPVMHQLFEIETAHILSDTDRATALSHLETIAKNSFVYDPPLLARTFEEIHHKELMAADTQTPLAERAFTDTIRAYDQALVTHPSRAKYWYLSSMVYYLNAVATKSSVPQIAIDQAERARTIAPNRVESLVALSNMANVNGETNRAVSLATEAVHRAPTDPESLWTLALLFAKKGDIDQAAPLGLSAIRHSLTLVNSEAISWIIHYYFNKKDAATVVYLYEQSVKIEPNKIDLLPKLAAAYAANGQKEKAIETANLLLQRAPESKPQVDAFIQSLQ